MNGYNVCHTFGLIQTNHANLENFNNNVKTWTLLAGLFLALSLVPVPRVVTVRHSQCPPFSVSTTSGIRRFWCRLLYEQKPASIVAKPHLLIWQNSSTKTMLPMHTRNI